MFKPIIAGRRIPEADYFIPGVDIVDFFALESKVFTVAVGTGGQDTSQVLGTTIKENLSFTDMLEEVIRLWQTEHMRAKVFFEDDAAYMLDPLSVESVSTMGNEYIVQAVMGVMMPEISLPVPGILKIEAMPKNTMKTLVSHKNGSFTELKDEKDAPTGQG